METTLKILELFSKNWLVVLVLILTIPVMKMAIQGYIQVKIAKITNHQKCLIAVETAEGRKTLEISSSELNIKDLSTQIATFQNPTITLLPSSKTKAS